MSIPMPDGSLRHVAVVPASNKPTPDELQSASPQVYPPVTRDGSTTYTHGSSEPLLFPITDGVPTTAEVSIGGEWKPAHLIRVDSVQADVLTALTRQTFGRKLTAALILVGSPDWPRGVLRIRIRLHDGKYRPIRQFGLVVR